MGVIIGELLGKFWKE